MASGFSTSGRTRGRCYPFISDYIGCVTDTGSDVECMAFREDYFECLYHRKEIYRAQLLENRKRELAAKGLWPPPPGTIYDDRQVPYQMFPTWKSRE